MYKEKENERNADLHNAKVLNGIALSFSTNQKSQRLTPKVFPLYTHSIFLHKKHYFLTWHVPAC